MSKPLENSANTIQAKVEQLADQAKQLHGAGKDAAALEAYHEAAELMPGAPWLQHRTAELARKLKQYELALHHYRRAAAAFVAAGFPKRGLSPLRTAFTLAVGELPINPSVFVSLTLELAELQRSLGFPADGALTISNANHLLRASGCAEQASSTPEPARAGDSGAPPESGVKPDAQPGMLGALAHFRANPGS